MVGQQKLRCANACYLGAGPSYFCTAAINCLQAGLSRASWYHFDLVFGADESLCTMYGINGRCNLNGDCRECCCMDLLALARPCWPERWRITQTAPSSECPAVSWCRSTLGRAAAWCESCLSWPGMRLSCSLSRWLLSNEREAFEAHATAESTQGRTEGGKKTGKTDRMKQTARSYSSVPKAA